MTKTVLLQLLPCLLLLFTGNLHAFTIHHRKHIDDKLRQYLALSSNNNGDSDSVDVVVNTNTNIKGLGLEVEKSPAVIVGGGPAGLLTAIMYAKTFPEATGIQVFDRLSQPPNPRDEAVWSDVTKFYLIGLGGRGQKALAKYGVWDDVKSVCTSVIGRKDWAPEAAVSCFEFELCIVIHISCLRIKFRFFHLSCYSCNVGR